MSVLPTLSAYIRDMMIASVDIQPHVGAMPIRFGMTKRAVDKLLGKPSYMDDSSASPNSKIAFYDGINLEYESPAMLVTGIVITEGVAALFGGQDLMSMPNPAAYLYQFDQDATAGAGYISFRNLCISVCGVIDPQADELSIHIENRWVWDEYQSLFKPWRPGV